jgi:hypothetical protein
MDIQHTKTALPLWKQIDVATILRIRLHVASGGIFLYSVIS